MRSATGDLEPWATVTQRQIAETYHVSAHVARNAIAELAAAGILGHFGRSSNVIARDTVQVNNRAHRASRILGLIALHVADLEAEVYNSWPRPTRYRQALTRGHTATAPRRTG
jgi:DNA-binding GntR family transcriptional regulator